jgi:hypothetical protein
MVVNGWRPDAENADHGKNSKAERLLEEHRASAAIGADDGGSRRRRGSSRKRLINASGQ